METTEIIRILRQCGSCSLTDCTECPEYHRSDSSEGQGFMWSCGGVLLEAADRLESLNKSGDLISREVALTALKGVIARTGLHGVAIEVILANLDSVEAEPVVHAHWNGDCCSACDELAEENYPRCPHCGAHMDEEVADEN